MAAYADVKSRPLTHAQWDNGTPPRPAGKNKKKKKALTFQPQAKRQKKKKRKAAQATKERRPLWPHRAQHKHTRRPKNDAPRRARTVRRRVLPGRLRGGRVCFFARAAEDAPVTSCCRCLSA